MIPVQIDHQTVGADRLTDAFKERTTVENVLKSLLSSLNLVEVSIFDLLSKRNIDNATNDSLDK